MAPAAANAALLDKLLPWRQQQTSIPGTIIGASAQRGHLLRTATLPASTSTSASTPMSSATTSTTTSPTTTSATTTTRTDIVIIGAGISGLVAAWQLKKSGIDDFVVLELEDVAGGNARSGENHRSQFPWGAHYVPLPHKNLTQVVELFEDLGIVTGHDADGNPQFDEYFICATPQERLKTHGRWQAGSLPQLGITESDRRDYQQFFALMDSMRKAVGNDGRLAFAIPLDHSSADVAFTALDRISMANYLQQHNLQSSELVWFIDYCCRDDFGVGIDQVSAWAGIHYFAARKHQKGEHGGNVLTWPQGNGYIVQQLVARLEGHIKTGVVAHAINDTGATPAVDYINIRDNSTHHIDARHVIFAAPRFVAAHVITSLQAQPPAYLAQMHYAPWIVANVSLRKLPSGNGASLSWDNVSRTTRSLGYVVANHQSLQMAPKGGVITWYMPLDHTTPKTARAQALATTHAQWCDMIVADLEAMHRGIGTDIESIDVCVWGHAMIAPVTGFLFSDARRALQAPLSQVSFAHTDMSGISIFEEAVYHGINAAQRAAAAVGSTLKQSATT